MANPRTPKASPPPLAETDTVTGVDFTDVRTGEDTRQRGWFWHWNELHTEYEPLLKHSGIGLITSYIVWTDRREHSPYRGYAFPSLQAQAAFSGSDRAELITINHILVALDLLEIRKEMVLRLDEQGHKWRVPHNLYRVKDRSDDPHLTARDVNRVLDLAEQRNDVYRHIRHILTSAFLPISHNNIWHQILPELRPTATWQRLATRALSEEARLSARSKAGHASRRVISSESQTLNRPLTQRSPAPVSVPIADDDFFVPGSEFTESTATGETRLSPASGQKTNVQPSNEGLPTRVQPGYQGLLDHRPTTDGASNQAPPTSVAPSNPMYDQLTQTTRTTNPDLVVAEAAVTGNPGLVTGAVTSEGYPLSRNDLGHAEHPAPDHGPDRAAALLAFHEANGREASVAEQRLLTVISVEAGERGWNLVASAIYEAVNSGSSFVAPKRVREIVRRWLRDGRLPGAGKGADLLISEHVRVEEFEVRQLASPGIAVQTPAPEQFWVEEAGLGSDSLWNAVIELVQETGEIRAADVHDYLKSAVLVERTSATTLRLAVSHEVTRQRIERKWRTALEEALGQLLGGGNWELDIEVMHHLQKRSA